MQSMLTETNHFLQSKNLHEDSTTNKQNTYHINITELHSISLLQRDFSPLSLIGSLHSAAAAATSVALGWHLLQSPL